MLLLVLISAICTSQVRAQTLQWIGQTFDTTTNSVTLSTLSDFGVINSTLGSFQLPIGSTIGEDLFRCMPYGYYCQFIFVDSTGSATLVNVSLSVQVQGQVALPPVDKIVSLHVDHSTDNSYFTTLTDSGSGASIMSVANDGTALTVVDLSNYLIQAGSGATINTGGATHCSNLKTMWVTISNNVTSSGLILTIDLDKGQVVNVTKLSFAGFISLWADCSEFDVKTDIPGGIVFDTRKSILSFGIVGTSGEFISQAVSGVISGGLEPTGLLTFANVFDTNYNYAALLYPPGSKPGEKVNGNIAFFSFEGPGMTLSPITYYLAGASLS